MPYTYRLRTRAGDVEGEVELSEPGMDIRLVGDEWQMEDDGVKWRVARVTAGDATRPPSIVLEPTDG